MIFFVVGLRMLSVVMLNGIMLSVRTLSVIMSVVMLSVRTLSVIMSVVMLSVFTL